MSTRTKVETRACTKCGVEYERTPENFWARSAGDGLHSWCKECTRTANREYRRKVLATPEGRAANAHSVFLSRIRTQPAYLNLHASARAMERLAESHPAEFEALKAQAADELRDRCAAPWADHRLPIPLAPIVLLDPDGRPETVRGTVS